MPLQIIQRRAAAADGYSADRRTDLPCEQEILYVAAGVGSSDKQASVYSSIGSRINVCELISSGPKKHTVVFLSLALSSDVASGREEGVWLQKQAAPVYCFHP